MNMEERLQATVSQAEADGEKWHRIIHGDDQTTVVTSGGTVPSVAKQLKDVRNEIVNGVEDYVGNCRTLKEETQQIKTQTDSIKNATNTIKNQAAEIKSEVEVIKSETEDLKRAAEIAVSYTSGPNLFDFKWADHKLNDISWLRSDTFSWQSGDVYTAAYQHLVDDLASATLKTDGLVDWVQPILTSNSTVTPLGTVTASAGSTYSGYDAYKALNGVNSGTTAASGWGTNNTSAVSWWQIKFPYKLKITGLKGYQRYDGTKANANTVGRFYTSSAKTTPIGNEYNNAVSLDWNAVEVTGIPEEGIITDTIYFEKTGGGNYGGLGELEITAQRLTQDYPISYYEAADGHKITTDEATVQAIYRLTGTSWYYILDTDNKKFKLPRDSSSHGELIESYHDGYRGYRIYADGYCVQWGKEDGSDRYVTVNLMKVYSDTNYIVQMSETYPSNNDNSRNACVTTGNTTPSSFYAYMNKNTMWMTFGYLDPQNGELKAKQKFLYCYVGNFSKEAIVQTAGINAELLSEKIDISGAAGQLDDHGVRTVIETYKNGTDWYRLWSDGWIEQGGELGWTSSAWANGTRVLIKPFRDTTYNLFVLGNWNNSESSSCTVSDKTTTDFTVRYAINTATQKGCWYACGF